MTVTRPVAVWIVPIAWGGGAPITWAQPPTAPSSSGTSQVPRNTLPLPVLWGAIYGVRVPSPGISAKPGAPPGREHGQGRTASDRKTVRTCPVGYRAVRGGADAAERPVRSQTRPQATAPKIRPGGRICRGNKLGQSLLGPRTRVELSNVLGPGWN